MKAVCFFFLLVVSDVELLVSPDGQLECGSLGCYDPTIQGCIENSGSIQCLNSCNGACYSNAQYCYNDVIICSNGELVCEIQNSVHPNWFPLGPKCYAPSQYSCYSDTLCENYLSCGTQCVNDYNTACANNQTLCPGFNARSYYGFNNDNLDVCGPQQQCYDKRVSVCLDETTVCQGMNAQLCGTECFNPDLQICVNDVVQCLNSCNGACYSNAQYCYNDAIICNNDELVCEIQNSVAPYWFPLGLKCYDPSQYSCYSNTLCENYLSCGTQCVNDYNTACANNQTHCPGFDAWSYYTFNHDNLDVCGPQEQCYDKTASVCFDDSGTICPIGNQLCSGVCYDPQSQYCVTGDNTVYCLNNPSSPNCPSTIITIPSTTTIALMNVSDCCEAQDCTTNSDCCQPGSQECQCYRHITTDVYGSCLNPYTTPICADGCPVEGKCKFDSDCCKCQCAQVTFTDLDGQSTTKKRCIRR